MAALQRVLLAGAELSFLEVRTLVALSRGSSGGGGQGGMGQLTWTTSVTLPLAPQILLLCSELCETHLGL